MQSGGVPFFAKSALLVLLLLPLLLDTLLALLVSLSPLFFSLVSFLLILGAHLLLALLLFLSLVLGSLLLGLGRDDALQVLNALLEAVHFRALAKELLVHS